MGSPTDERDADAGWITPSLVAETRKAFSFYYPPEELTDADILALLQTLGGVFEVLYGERPDELPE